LEPKIKITGNTVQNQFFKVKVDPSTGLIDVFQNGKWLTKGNELVLEEELGDLYYHRQNLEQPLKTEGEEGIKYGKFKIKSFKIQKTPLRRVINIESDYFSLRWPYRLLDKMKPLLWRHKFISVSKKIIIYDNLPRIDFVTAINNQHPQARIRVRFSTNIKSLQYHSESQFGVVSRPVNQHYFNPKKGWAEKPCGVYPALNWIDYSDKEKGLTLINNGLPAHEIRDGQIYLTLLRSILMLSSDGITGPAIPTPDAQEFKNYSFSYSLFPHQKNWKEKSSFRLAQEYNYNLIAFQLPPERSKKFLPSHFSFLEIKPNNLILTAFKKVERGNEIILRFFETKGEKTEGEISLFKKPKAVRVVDLLEENNWPENQKIKIGGKKIRLTVKPFEIVTLRLKF